MVPDLWRTLHQQRPKRLDHEDCVEAALPTTEAKGDRQATESTTGAEHCISCQ